SNYKFSSTGALLGCIAKFLRLNHLDLNLSVREEISLQELFLIKEKEESGLRKNLLVVRKSTRKLQKYPETSLKVVYDTLSYDGFIYMFDEIKELNQLNNLEDLELALECLQQMARNVEIMSSSSNISDGVKMVVHQVENKLLSNLDRAEFIIKLVEDSKDRPPSFIAILVASIHRFLSMIEHFSKKRHIYVIRASHKEKLEDNRAKAYSVGFSKKSRAEYNEGKTKAEHFRDTEHVKKYLKLELSEEDRLFRRNLFCQFEKKFANEKVIDTYMSYINDYEVHEKYKCDFYSVNVMFERICVNQNSMDLFIKVKYLNVMSRILRAWDRIANNLKAGNHEDPNLSSSQEDFLDLVKDVCNKIYKEMKVESLFAPNYEMFSLFEEIDKVILSYTSFLEKQKSHQEKDERFKHRVSKPQFTDEEREFYMKLSVKQLIREGQLMHIKWLQETMIKLGCQRITEEQIAAKKYAELSYSKVAEEPRLLYADHRILPKTAKVQKLLNYYGFFNFSDNFICRLMWTLQFERKFGIEGPYWIIPSTLPGKYLISQAELVEKYVEECQDELKVKRSRNEGAKDLNDSDDTIESDAEEGSNLDDEDMDSDYTLKSDISENYSVPIKRKRQSDVLPMCRNFRVRRLRL
ncbi:12414_t:CDS:10, partial [Acaulospora morrowiae]